MHARSAEICARALEYADRPYRHQGRSWTSGVDCAGLVIRVGHDLGLGDFDTADYSRRPNLIEFDRAMRASGCTVVSHRNMAPGDILRVAEASWPVHCGIFTGDRFVHAWLPARRVVAETVTPARMAKVSSVWRYPE